MQAHTEEKTTLQFKSIDGKPISDPRLAIAKTTHAADEAKKINYQATDTATHTAIAELWGRRPTQEDRLVIGQLPDFDALPPAARTAALTETIRTLETIIEQKRIPAGATLCVTVLAGKKLYNANVGDSESYLVIKDKNNVVTHFSRINTVIHHITAANQQALRKQGINVQPAFGGPRLMTPDGAFGMNLYRSMGDTKLNSVGLEHHPDIYTPEVDIPDGGSALVINACDGLTENLTQKELEKIIRDNTNTSLEDLPRILAQAAYESGSGDNISVLVTPIEPNAPTKYLAVFDGHGGTDVAEFLEKTFHNTLKKQITLTYLDTVKQTLGEPFKSSVTGIDQEVETVVAALNQKHPALGLSQLYETIQSNFIRELNEEKQTDSQKKTQLMTHAGQMLNLITSIQEALMLSTELGTKAPSSFSPEFAAWHGEGNQSAIISSLEAKARDALIACINLANVTHADTKALLEPLSATMKAANGTRKISDDGVKQLVKDLVKSTKEARNAIKQIVAQIRRFNDEVLPNRDVLQRQLPALLKDRYNAILVEAKSLNDTLENPGVYPKDAVDKLLFSLYVEIYKNTRVKTLFGSSHVTENFANQLEKMLAERCPDLHNNLPHAGVKNTPENRILAYAGNKYPQLVEATRAELLALGEKGSAADNKKAYVTHGKLLQRLGESGFAAASTVFTGKPDQYVKESGIESHYDNLRKAASRVKFEKK
jgi:serine/threonine protein phosphatase PrpC